MPSTLRIITSGVQEEESKKMSQSSKGLETQKEVKRRKAKNWKKWFSLIESRVT